MIKNPEKVHILCKFYDKRALQEHNSVYLTSKNPSDNPQRALNDRLWKTAAKLMWCSSSLCRFKSSARGLNCSINAEITGSSCYYYTPLLNTLVLLPCFNVTIADNYRITMAFLCQNNVNFGACNYSNKAITLNNSSFLSWHSFFQRKLDFGRKIQNIALLCSVNRLTDWLVPKFAAGLLV